MRQRFNSFAEFYLFCLAEHGKRTCRRLHFAGTSLVIGCVLAAVVVSNPWWLLAAPLCGYGLAWVGHLFFEHNRPATFSHPFYSLASDWVMYKQMLIGRVPW